MTDFIPVGDLVKEASNWLASALARRRNERIAAAANTIYHSRLIVIQMRSLRDQLKSLLGPLRGFNPTDWPSDRRASLIGDLRTFADRLPTFGIMNEHAHALQELGEKPIQEVIPNRDKIIRNAFDVSHVGSRESIDKMGVTGRAEAQARIADRTTELNWHSDIEKYQRRGYDEEGGVTLYFGPDQIISYYLPALLWLVRNANADNREQVRALRVLADGLLRTRSDRGDQPLEELVEETEIEFGRLTGILLKKYPDLPRPTWGQSH